MFSINIYVMVGYHEQKNTGVNKNQNLSILEITVMEQLLHSLIYIGSSVEAMRLHSFEQGYPFCQETSLPGCCT